jgi:hypothetical protein
VLCDEAVEMAKKDDRLLGRIIYAAANGKARDANNRDGTARKSGRFSTVTCFTNNTHLLALPDRVLNEATRRRVFELTYEKEHIMPLDDGNILYHAADEHYGHAGRVFLSYVVQHREAIAVRYKARLSQMSKGIGKSNHYNLWLITAASVAYEIGRDLGIFKFTFNDVLQQALNRVTAQDKMITPSSERVQEFLTRYLQMFQGYITQKHAGNKGVWIGNDVRGEVRARYTVETDKTFTLCLPVKQFSEWVLQHNIDINHIRQWAKDKGIEQKKERIAPKTDAVPCFIIPGFTDLDTDTVEGIK